MLEFFLKGNYDVTKRIKNKLKKIAKEGNKNALEAYNKTKEGYVYIITNPAWEGWVKIGMAVDADDRGNGYQTSSPFRDYKIEHVVVTNNRRAAEAEAHKLANKIAREVRGEWFKLDIEQAKIILNNITIDLKKAA